MSGQYFPSAAARWWGLPSRTIVVPRPGHRSSKQGTLGRCATVAPHLGQTQQPREPMPNPSGRIIVIPFSLGPSVVVPSSPQPLIPHPMVGTRGPPAGGATPKPFLKIVARTVPDHLDVHEGPATLVLRIRYFLSGYSKSPRWYADRNSLQDNPSSARMVAKPSKTERRQGCQVPSPQDDPAGGAHNLRNHRKILIADGRAAFTGGMNIGDRRMADRTDNPDPVEDFHFRLVGPVVKQLQQVFFEDWPSGADCERSRSRRSMAAAYRSGFGTHQRHHNTDRPPAHVPR